MTLKCDLLKFKFELSSNSEREKHHLFLLLIAYTRGTSDPLADVFTDIFNIFLSQAVVPICFKKTTIIPVP